jgi:hypothetical protein
MTYYEFMDVIKKPIWLHSGVEVKISKARTIYGSSFTKNDDDTISLGYMDDEGTEDFRTSKITNLEINPHWATKSVFEDWQDNE